MKITNQIIRNIAGRLLPAIFIAALMAGFSSCVEEPDDLLPWRHGDEWTNISTAGGLSGNCVYSIIEDSLGNMWFGTNNGVTMLSPEGQFTRYGERDGILGNHVHTILNASDGTFYLGTNRGLTIAYDQTIENIETLVGYYFSVFDIIEDGRQNIWFATNTFGAIYLSVEDDQLYQPDYTGCPGCYYANSLFEDSAGKIWIGSMGGALRYDYSNLKKFTTADGLSTDMVQSIAEDRWGDIWIGPRGGKNPGRYDGSRIHLVTLLTDYDTDYVMDIALDMRGELWFGLVSAGAVHYNGTFMRQYVSKDGLKDPSVMSIYPDSKGNIWFGSLSSGVYKYTPGLKQ